MKKLYLSNNIVLKDVGYPKIQLPDVEVELFNFPSGEQHLKLKEIDANEKVMIVSRFNKASDLVNIALAKDILNRNDCTDVSLFIPFVYGGRQDRITSKEEPLTVKVMANMINSLGFKRIYTYNNHSYAIENNYNSYMRKDFSHIESYETNEILRILNNNHKEINLVSVDYGSAKKIYALANVLRKHDIKTNTIQLDKIRDISTGKIVRTEVLTDITNPKLPTFIVDDICDGGRSFLEAAKMLKGKSIENIHLIITHGIFSNGFRDLSREFTTITSTTSIIDPNESVERQKQLDKYKNITFINKFYI